MVAFTRKLNKTSRSTIRKERNQPKGIYRGLKPKTTRTAKTTKSVKVAVTRRKTHLEKLLNNAKTVLGPNSRSYVRSERAQTLKARKNAVEAKAKAEVEAKAKARRIKQAEKNAEKAANRWLAMDRKEQNALIEELRTYRRLHRPIPANISNLSERFGKLSTGTITASSNSHAPWRGNTTKKYLKRVQEENE